VWSVVVVPGNEQRDRQGPRGIVRELVAVRALALNRADESLGPAVRPGVPGLRPGVADRRGPTGVAEREAPVRRAVVAEHPLDPDALAREERGRPIKERRAIAAPESRAELGEGHPAGHVDRHVQVLPADAAALSAMHLGAAAAAALDAAEALDVNPHELARPQGRVRPEAPRRLGEEVAEAVRAVAAQDPVDRARVQAEGRADPVRPVLRVHPQRHHGALEGV